MKRFFFIIGLVAFTGINLIRADTFEQSVYASIVHNGQDILGYRHIPSIAGHSFLQDCIGFIHYIFYASGIDLLDACSLGDRGVDTLYNGLNELGYAYEQGLPEPGDLIFFDNTYDANRNHSWDDKLTHIGIVESVGEYETVTFLHFVSHKVTRSTINMRYPNTHAFRMSDGRLMIINSYIRENRGEGFKRRAYIASSFFHGYARIPLRLE